MARCIYAIMVDGLPRYIGQSAAPQRRFAGHLREVRRRRTDGLLYRQLRAALRRGAAIECLVVADRLSQEQADDLERNLITLLGGHTRRGRQLWNAHGGGRGGASEASTAILRNRWANDPDFRAKVSKASREQIAAQRADPEFDRRRIDAVKKRQRSPEGLAQLAAARARRDPAERCATAGATLKRLWADPAYRERQTAIIREAALSRYALKRGEAG